eukprot:Trichotokara_eunicae@DN4914_c0_g1_i1.p1
MNAARRLLQEIEHATTYFQISPYRQSEVNTVEREIVEHQHALVKILSRAKGTDPTDADENLDPDENPGTVIPSNIRVALWIHVSAIQQLTRALSIYRRKRYEWLARYAFEELRVASRIPDALAEKLSAEESSILSKLRRLLAVNDIGKIVNSLPLEPVKSTSNFSTVVIDTNPDLMTSGQEPVRVQWFFGGVGAATTTTGGQKNTTGVAAASLVE